MHTKTPQKIVKKMNRNLVSCSVNPEKKKKSIIQDFCFVHQNMNHDSTYADVHNLNQSKVVLRELCPPGALLLHVPILMLYFLCSCCAGSDTLLVP